MRMSREERLMRANERKVERLYPNRLTNDGWLTGPDFYCTKVYGDPCMVVCTGFDSEGKITHEVSEKEVGDQPYMLAEVWWNSLPTSARSAILQSVWEINGCPPNRKRSAR